MKRHPAFDPPEYVDWTPDPALVRAFAEHLQSDPDRIGIVEQLSENDLLTMYRDLLRTRLHDLGLKRWVRTGIISKAWLCTGEEAVTVGSVSALAPARDVVSPMIHNAGTLHMMGMPLSDMFRGYLSTAYSPSRGRDLHIGDLPKASSSRSATWERSSPASRWPRSVEGRTEWRSPGSATEPPRPPPVTRA